MRGSGGGTTADGIWEQSPNRRRQGGVPAIGDFYDFFNKNNAF